MKRIIILFCILIFFAGCGSIRTVYLQPGEAVMLREDVKNVKLWVKTENGEILPTVGTLFEGGFYMSLSDEELKALNMEYLIKFKDPEAGKK